MRLFLFASKYILPVHHPFLRKHTSKVIELHRIARTWVSGYHADTPITIKAEAIHEANSHIH